MAGPSKVDTDDFATTSLHFAVRRNAIPNLNRNQTSAAHPSSAKNIIDSHSDVPARKRLRRAGSIEAQAARKRKSSEDPNLDSNITSPAPSTGSADSVDSVQILTSPGEVKSGRDDEEENVQNKLQGFRVDSAGPSSRSSSMSRNGSFIPGKSSTLATSQGPSRLGQSDVSIFHDSEHDHESDSEMVVDETQSSQPVGRMGQKGDRGTTRKPFIANIDLQSSDSPSSTRPSSPTANSTTEDEPPPGQNQAFDRFVTSLHAAGPDFTRSAIYRAFVEAKGDCQQGIRMLVAQAANGNKSTQPIASDMTASVAPVPKPQITQKTVTTKKMTTQSSSTAPREKSSSSMALQSQAEVNRRIKSVIDRFGPPKPVDQELRDAAIFLSDIRHFEAFARSWKHEALGSINEQSAAALKQYREFLKARSKSLSNRSTHPTTLSNHNVNPTVGKKVNGDSFYAKSETLTKTKASTSSPKPKLVSTFRKVETSGSILERQLAAAAMLNKPRKKPKSRRRDEGDDEGSHDEGDDGAWNSDASGGDAGYDSDGDAAIVRQSEQIAVEWFNTTTKEQLMELAGCTLAQAQLTIQLRPFENSDDFRRRTRKQKGVGNGMLEAYLDVIAGMQEVDRILRDCERIGEDLAQTMKIWSDVAGNNKTAAPKSEGSDVGLNLVAFTDQATVTRSSDLKVRAAFDQYVWKQPSGVPSTITLKDYQMLGVNWLNLLYRKRLSCILADEMGLGKTAQVIALLSHLKSIGEEGPHLVVVPASTLENWRREFATFAPDLVVELYYGSQDERAEQRYDLREMTNLDVVITTYDQATSKPDDRKFLSKKLKFKIAIFDEGHMLKNSESKKHKELMQLRAQWRLLLTGTPLQNNLQELVSLLSFILPDQFHDSSESLRAIFKVTAGQSASLLSRERISRAKKMMTPFVLRRKKAQVLKDLPKKLERIEWCEMTDLQREVYDEAMMRSRKALLGASDADLEQLGDLVEDDDTTTTATTSKKKKALPLTHSNTGRKSDASSSSHVLMDLRKAASHPMLFRRLYDDDLVFEMSKDCLKELEFVDSRRDLVEEDLGVMTDFEIHRFCLQYKNLRKYALLNDEWMSAGKIHYLQSTLPDLRAKGDRVLLFSQFVMILDILEVVLDTMGIRYLKLTGQTTVTERQGLVDAYNNDSDITVFLLSTRAGGLGLNLTAANTVIFYDQDYNPHNDKQAEDRAYRIGQTRDVNIIKLITRDSLEEDMLRLAINKLQLDSEVSGSIHPTTTTTSVTSGSSLSSSTTTTTTTKTKTLVLPPNVSTISDEMGDGVDEASLIEGEKKTKTSLLSGLKKKFVALEQQQQQQQQASQSSITREGGGTLSSPTKKV